MKNLNPGKYASTASLVSEQISRRELVIILTELEKTQELTGDVVEFGCYVGTTTVHLQRWLADSNKTLHVYDSFAGLPEKTSADQSPAGEQFRPGELCASKKQLILNCKKFGVSQPIIHKAWFDELPSSEVPGRISFAFLDGDYYESVKVPLRLIESRLVPGAIIVVDDYANEALPGAARAVDEWRKQTTLQTTLRVEQSLAIMSVAV